jgi:hypothetical protein
MYLQINDRIIQNPSKAVVLESVAKSPPPGAYALLLARNKQDSLEADGRADGLYDVAYVKDRAIHDGKRFSRDAAGDACQFFRRW